MSTPLELIERQEIKSIQSALCSSDETERKKMARELLTIAKLRQAENLTFLAPILLRVLGNKDNEVCEVAAYILAKIALYTPHTYRDHCAPAEMRQLLNIIFKKKHKGIRKSIIQIMMVESLETGDLSSARELLAHSSQKVQLSAISSVLRCGSSGWSIAELIGDLAELMKSDNKKLVKQIARNLTSWLEEKPQVLDVIELKDQLFFLSYFDWIDLIKLCTAYIERSAEHSKTEEEDGGDSFIARLNRHQKFLQDGWGGSSWTVHLGQMKMVMYMGISENQADFSEESLFNDVLARVNLSSANLFQVTYEGQSLSYANLSNSLLAKGFFSGSNFSNTTLVNARLDEAVLDHCVFHNADLSGADFSGANLSNADLSTATLSDTNFTGAILTNTIFPEHYDPHPVITDEIPIQREISPLDSETFQNILDLHHRWLEQGKGGCDWTVNHDHGVTTVFCSGDTQDQADLSFRDLSEVTLSNKNFRCANLTGVRCHRKDLTNADLGNCSLAGGDFTGSDFSGVDLSFATLAHAVLTDCIFIGATFEETNFEGVSVEGAIFDSGVDLVRLTQEAIDADSAIQMPEIDWDRARALGLMEGLSPSSRGDYDELLHRIAQHDQKTKALAEQYGQIKDSDQLYSANERLALSVLDSPENLNKLLKDGYTPLNLAIDVDSVDVVQRLLAAGADPNLAGADIKISKRDIFNKYLPLMWACGRDLKIIQLLIDAGADPNRLSDQETPLDHYINYIGDGPNGPELTKYLLDAGADPKRSRSFPFAMAVVRRAPREILLALLEAGADLNEVHPDLGTALHISVEEEDLDTLSFLIQQGADCSKLNHDGLTPLEYALEYRFENHELIECLKQLCQS